MMFYHLAFYLFLASIASIAVIGWRLVCTTIYSAGVPDELLAGILFEGLPTSSKVISDDSLAENPYLTNENEGISIVLYKEARDG